MESNRSQRSNGVPGEERGDVVRCVNRMALLATKVKTRRVFETVNGRWQVIRDEDEKRVGGLDDGDDVGRCRRRTRRRQGEREKRNEAVFDMDNVSISGWL